MDGRPERYTARRDCPDHAAAQHEKARTSGELPHVTSEAGRPARLVTRMADVRAMLRDPNVSSDPKRPGFPLAHPDQGHTTTESIIRQDPPEHDRVRKLFIAAFGVRRTSALSDGIVAAAHRAVDAMTARGRMADVVIDYAIQVPAAVIALFLGIPSSSLADFHHVALEVIDTSLPEERRTAANDELESLVDRLLRPATPVRPDGLLAQVARHIAGGRLTRLQAVRNLRLIIAAGHETTGNMIALSALSALRDDTVRRALLADERSAANLVEELLRHWSVVQAGPRRAVVRPTRIGGHSIEARQGLIVSLPAANRDPGAFDGGRHGLDHIDPMRDARGHVAFGFGVHQCLGQHLARVELRTALRVLFTRLPGLRPLTDLDRPDYLTEHAILGVRTLPVRW